ncbi:NAD(P)/FAD-dependent oxidoreductase [Halomonas halocynthiae]|uniref:NAD(P)/FAD-dependent oxidoreductase n=1 Tax=Halomonas halocynthiae TaxID=176290 RepID=UPI0004825E61|nr:FAD-dependent oxidoreductase [Halomonas halocynthiae]
MRSSQAPLALVGAGHAHLHLLANRHRLPVQHVILIEPRGFWYSGMASGVLGEQYSPADDRLEPANIVKQANQHGKVSLIRARLVGLNRPQRKILLDNGASFSVSAVSLNLGSRTALKEVDCHSPQNIDNGIKNKRPHAPLPWLWPVKPISALVKLRQQLTSEFYQGINPRLVVIGAGASGIEIACNLRALANHHGSDASVTVVSRSADPLPGAPPNASRWLIHYFKKMGIALRGARDFLQCVNGGVLLSSTTTVIEHEYIDADHVVIASGLAPPDVMTNLGLPTVEGRGLAVTDTLQSTAADWVFAAGDCAAMINHSLPRLGVYGVRQAPILRDNLSAWYTHKPLSRYHPQPHALTILNLGNGTGLAIRGRAWFAGRLAMKAKRWLDKRFLDQFTP